VHAERAIVTWLRTRPGVVFTDTLRPFLVRRAELRPVVEALDEHGALGAVPLVEDGELVGAIILPRGRRTDVPTWEEEVRLLRVARGVSGSLAELALLNQGVTFSVYKDSRGTEKKNVGRARCRSARKTSVVSTASGLGINLRDAS